MTIRNAFENLALDSTLAAIRDSIFRRTDPLPAGSNNIGYVSPSTSQHVVNQRFFVASSGRLTLTAAGNVRSVFTNPAGSGRNMFLVRLASFASSGPSYATVIINPTTGLPTSAVRRANNAILHAGTGLGEVRSDVDLTTPLGGGTDTGLVFGIPAGSRLTLDLPPFFLAPGVSIGFNIPFAGASDATMSIYWFEVNV